MTEPVKNRMVILEDRATGQVDPDPLTKKYYLEIEPPRLGFNQADTDRLRDALAQAGAGPVEVPLALMRLIPDLCRESDWAVTATVGRGSAGPRLVALEPGDTTARHYGLAVDVGTTTVVAYLVDMNTGETVGTAADYNGQVPLGEDILTRIYLSATAEGLARMQEAVVGTLNSLVERLGEKHAVLPPEISAVVVGANSTMVHLLLGLDPKMICREPYTPVVNNPGFLTAGEIGLAVNPGAVLYCLPGVGSYVGGDVIAGVLVSGMHREKELSLLVDIGTNGEMVLGNEDWLVACAGAAGPALEGGVARSGMRAEPGAVEWVRIDPVTRRVSYRTIGGEKPRGICGSGLIDCLAQFLLTGIIDRSGYFRNGRRSFTIVPAAESATGEDIAVSQLDINNFMRTKGAVNAALETLMESVGVSLADLDRFYAAGAFGMYLDLESSITIGLYPDLPREKMVRLGNSSGEGARLVLLSEKMRLEAEKIARSITYFELNANQEFMNRFVGSKFLPHTNLDFYPTVKAKLMGDN
ncbi:MAG: ASKHA domain-containing protein [Firmicutes bacterium]|nr:ASKHA domain-containing protein [Bacillota bacterium]